ncbi:MAG TPA: hypothetical protein VMF08_20140 [Candidatus Sulfotelmatobacter sp.]|nr:hypothetical protein [Candidatus Sulfotelmatobacter sp.]
MLSVLRHGLRVGMHVEFFVNPPDVGVHRMGTDFEMVSNLLFGMAPRKQVQHLTFPFGKRLIIVGFPGLLALKCLATSRAMPLLMGEPPVCTKRKAANNSSLEVRFSR